MSNLNGGASTAATDLQKTRSDASQRPDDQCINANTTVYNEAATTLCNDQVTSLANEVPTLQQDIGTVKHDITTLQGDLQTLQSDGLAAPANPSSVRLRHVSTGTRLNSMLPGPSHDHIARERTWLM